jgi:hypothetical protein
LRKTGWGWSNVCAMIPVGKSKILIRIFLSNYKSNITRGQF